MYAEAEKRGAYESPRMPLWGEEENHWDRQRCLFGHQGAESWTDEEISRLHEQVLLRELEDLRNGEVSDKVKFGIWVWVLDPIVSDRGDQDEPFTFHACCHQAGYSATSLIKSLISSRKNEVDRLFKPGAAQKLWARADELEEPATHCLARAMSTREMGVTHA